MPLTEFHRRFDAAAEDDLVRLERVISFARCSVAEKFAISKKTVKHHLTHIFNKVGVSNRLELALFAVHHDSDSSTL